ncbi:MAG: glycosyltransferase family 2 protein, partial [Deltaproteobacteria bacterium]|nr:glycosyltransferase family 2 protein [Deltaproteobacteria bacterium]
MDSEKFRPLREIAETPRSAVIYSYRIDDGKLETILKACGVLGIRCRRIGEKPGVLHQDDVAAQINEADIVFTLGRGAIETMMCGKIPIIYDYQGGDGMVTPENIHELMRCNFSGRLHGISYTVQQLIDEIKKYKPENGPGLRRLALELFDASRVVDTLVLILNKAIEDFSKSAAVIQREKIKDLVEIITTTKNYTIEAARKTAAYRRNENRISFHAEMPTGIRADEPDRATTYHQDIAKSDAKRSPHVSIVIPVFNKIDFTRRCLDALSHNTPRGLYECIIVDNASTDGTGEYLKSLGNRIKAITNAANLGFAKACNQGARAATAPYILFLNNDTEPQPGWLEPLVEILDRDASAAAVGGKMLFPDGTIQHAGVLILDDRKLPDSLVARHIYYNQPSDFKEANEPRIYQALTAACLLIRRKAFEEVGGFDEGYWNGYEDIDLCFKLQEKGWVLVYQPGSVLIHHESKSGPERFTKVRENIIQLHSRWLGRIKPDAVIEKDGSFRWTDARRIQIYKIPKGEAIEEPAKGQTDLISIVILTFNELDYTKRCVESIRKNTSEPHEIIFVDNGSKDGTAKWLRKFAKVNPNYRLIENRENLGFARGCNQGIEASKGEYILLLNNDVLVTENWLPGMLEHLKSSPEIGIVGPITNNISGIQKAEGVTYKSADDLVVYAREFRDRNRHRRVASRRLVGFCMLFRRSLVNEIGPLDESFGTGNFEDDDFCLRAALAGYRNVIAGDVFIHHYGSRSFIGNRINYGTSLTGNRKIFDDKWRGMQLDEGLGRHCLALKKVEVAREQYQLGRLNKAVDLYLEAIKFVPSENKSYHELAEVLIQTRNFKDALDVLRQIPPESRNEKTWVLTGFAKEGLNEDKEARNLADHVHNLKDFEAESLNLKG